MRTRENFRGNKNICGLRIEVLRKSKGIKQRDMVEALLEQGVEMSVSGLSKLEGQHRGISDFELLAFAEILAVSTDELLGRQ